MSGRIVNNDGLMITRFHTNAHEGRNGKTYGTLEQPSRKLILERNAELQKNEGAIRDLSFGRQVASIPLIDYFALRNKYPKLRQGNARERTAEMMRVLKLPENKKFLVRSKV